MASLARDRAGTPLSTGAVAGTLIVLKTLAVATAVAAAACIFVVVFPFAIIRHRMRASAAPGLRTAMAR